MSDDKKPLEWWIYSEPGHQDHVKWGAKPQHKDAWKYINVVEKRFLDTAIIERDEALAGIAGRDAISMEMNGQIENLKWKEAAAILTLNEERAKVAKLVEAVDSLRRYAPEVFCLYGLAAAFKPYSDKESI